MSENPNEPASHAEVATAVEAILVRFDTERRAEESAAKAKAARKEALTNRVSLAAIGITMLMSFLGFARSERAGASQNASEQAARAKADAEADWAYYQTRTAERASYQLADDALIREAAAFPDGDPRVRMAEVHHADYVARAAAIDQENRQVFFAEQDLTQRRITLTREAARIDRKVDRYDTGTRVLTLAVVLLSVTLLANRESLFWVGLGVALIGASIAVGGYFVVF